MKIEGRNSVRELLRTKKVLIANGLRDDESKNLLNIIKSAGVKFQFADKSVLDKESESRRHQGFIAYVSDYKYTELDDILSDAKGKEDAFIVVLDGVEDPHNLGSIIRVCECAGVDGLIIGKRRSASVTDAVMRISEGAANHVKIARVTNINAAIERIKEENIWTYALELGGADIYKTKLTGRICMVICSRPPSAKNDWPLSASCASGAAHGRSTEALSAPALTAQRETSSPARRAKQSTRPAARG